jgi:hypothetical protein
VWAVLADGWTYSQWVVGNSRMRAVSPHRPNAGKARITMRLFDIEGGGCRIEMAEVPVGAPMGCVPNRLAEPR